MPVLPPTAASTIASSVVGTWTTRTPRSQVAATKPARSVTAPPPTPTTASERVKPACPSTCQQNARTAEVFASSPSGTSAATASKPCATRSSRIGLTGRAQGPRVDDEHPLRGTEQRRELGEQTGADEDVVALAGRSVPRAARADADRRRVAHRTPSLRSVGASRPLAHRESLQRGRHLVGDLLRGPVVGADGDGRDPLVDRAAPLQEPQPLRPRVAEADGSLPGEAEPARGGRDVDVEEDHDLPAQRLLDERVDDRAAAEDDDRTVGPEGAVHRGPLELAERLLAVVDEDLGHRLAGGGRHLVVRVDQRRAEPGGQSLPRLGDERAGRTDEHHRRAHDRPPSWQQ